MAIDGGLRGVAQCLSCGRPVVVGQQAAVACFHPGGHRIGIAQPRLYALQQTRHGGGDHCLHHGATRVAVAHGVAHFTVVLDQVLLDAHHVLGGQQLVVVVQVVGQHGFHDHVACRERVGVERQAAAELVEEVDRRLLEAIAGSGCAESPQHLAVPSLLRLPGRPGKRGVMVGQDLVGAAAHDASFQAQQVLDRISAVVGEVGDLAVGRALRWVVGHMTGRSACRTHRAGAALPGLGHVVVGVLGPGIALDIHRIGIETADARGHGRRKCRAGHGNGGLRAIARGADPRRGLRPGEDGIAPAMVGDVQLCPRAAGRRGGEDVGAHPQSLDPAQNPAIGALGEPGGDIRAIERHLQRTGRAALGQHNFNIGIAVADHVGPVGQAAYLDDTQA